MRLIRRLTDFRSDYRDTISYWFLLFFRCRLHSSIGAYRLFEISLRQHNYSRAEEICLLSSKRFGQVLDPFLAPMVASLAYIVAAWAMIWRSWSRP